MLAGPAAARSASDWHATRTVQVRIEGAQSAWAAVSKAPLHGPQVCRRQAPASAGRVPPGP
eukprot:13222039-Alexandrium_andersonii.AAC.1